MHVIAFLWLFLFFLAVVLRQGLSLDPRRLPSALINKPLPDFNLATVEGGAPIRFTQKTFLGKVSLLNVWASWCASCQTEHPVLMKIAKTHEVNIYGLDYKDKRADAHRWLKTLGNPYVDVGFDEQGSLGIDLGVYGTPETYIIDQDGIIRYKWVGPLTDAVWEQELLPIVQKLTRGGVSTS